MYAFVGMSPNSYPVRFEAPLPLRFDRVQVALRLLVLVAVGFLNHTAGGLFGLLYLFLPIAAAILIPQTGSNGFLETGGRRLAAVIRWVIALYAYLLFVTDRFPLEPGATRIRFSIHPSGTPSVGSALLRLVTSLPHVAVLAVLGMISGLVGLVIGITVLVTESCPPTLHGFQRDVVAWIARVLAYHASLVTQYPPFSLTAAGAPPDAGDARHAASA